MRCPQCNADNPDDMRFCTNCGAKLEAPASPAPPAASGTHCPQCGSQVRPQARFCDNCGQALTEPTPRPAPAAPQPATPQVARALPLPNMIAAAVGAIMMLASLAVAWYTIRYMGYSEDVSASDLITETGNGGPIWAGSALPLILIIVFAALVLISVIYSFVARSAARSLWALLGTLCAWCVIGNAIYILWYLYDSTRDWTGEGAWINIVQVGCVLAFVGALVVIFSGAIGRRRA